VSAAEDLRAIVRLLVDEPRAVTVETVAGDGEWLLEVNVAPADRGKVIGRQGRTIESLRALASARPPDEGHLYEVELVD
jgi:predicted RNA-binding protein YlqC (UPF0109 family)